MGCANAKISGNIAAQRTKAIATRYAAIRSFSATARGSVELISMQGPGPQCSFPAHPKPQSPAI
ncbi:hypothetical protein PGTUg99_024152 [Puccinia graminis f. sp. tritici]|uniref:Uncharacterized protein n=1 Tax=Puccinia graminis f. sp. tritici TaxID=56615 RepID=A0A5B0RIZ0_PUCGR|nr:hypothetical protein PGTUg99_024152 [Puccinia graminis f. sp. tritici]